MPSQKGFQKWSIIITFAMEVGCIQGKWFESTCGNLVGIHSYDISTLVL